VTSSEEIMFDTKILLIILAIALVILGTKRLRSIGSDLGGAVKGFKQALGEVEEPPSPPTRDHQ
jgi:sec-independent protein translocase protein TatA